MTDRCAERRGRWTYALVTPDGLILEPLTGLISKLRRHGLEPRAGRLLLVDAEAMLDIYTWRTSPPSPSARRILELWYSLGPSCVLLLHHNGGDACAAMLTAKGATDPMQARADSIRHKGETTLLNLVHCPDDESAAEWELTRLLGEEEAFEMRRAAASKGDQVRLLTADSLADALPACSGREALSVPLIVNKLRLRLVQRMSLRSHHQAEALRTLSETRRELQCERDELVGVATSAARLEVARNYNTAIHRRLHEVAGACGKPAWTTAAQALSTSIMGPPEERLRALAAVVASGLYVSHPESVALELHAHAV